MSTPPTLNEQYFWEFVVFKVENELFKVPKHGFANNPYPPFNEIFSTLPEGAEGKEGTSTDSPIVLEQISKVDFERFLSVLYPQFKTPKRKTEDDSKMDPEIHLSVVKLSSLWNFIDIRRTTIDQLSAYSSSKFTQTDRIVLGRQYGVLEWFISAVIFLGHTYSEEITRPDARKIGLDTTLSLYYLRNRIRDASAKRSRNHIDIGPVLRTLSDGIQELFKEDIRDIVSKARAYEPSPNGWRGKVDFLTGSFPEVPLFEGQWSVDEDGSFSMAWLLA